MPWDGEPEPAGLCRAARSRRLQQRRHDDVGERLAAGHLPGNRDPVARRGHPRPASRCSLPDGIQRNNLDALARLNEERRKLYPSETELDARIRNYELAAQMQLSAEEVLDIGRETAATLRLYGLDDPVTANFGTRCLMARRSGRVGGSVRAGDGAGQVRRHAVGPSREHQERPGGLCPQVDCPTAGLIRDLKQRGLLESTIVLWTGEFGRLPISQKGNGRDHNRNAFSLVLAGGGFKSGHVHGHTDDFGYQAVEGRVSCPDLLATILHQLGLDHDRLSTCITGGRNR